MMVERARPASPRPSSLRPSSLWPSGLCLVLSALVPFVLVLSSKGTLAQIPRDGINGCSVAEVETDQGRVYRHTIDVQVPEGGHCRVYIGDDKDGKTWTYCWLKRASDNPVSETCDDPIDVEHFDVWRAKAVCGKLNSRAYCRRDKPLEPGRR